MFQNLMSISKIEQNLQRNLSVSYKIAFELVAVNCHFYERNAWNWPSMGNETVLRFYFSLRETFSNSISATVIKKSDKSAAMHISAVFWIL